MHKRARLYSTHSSTLTVSRGGQAKVLHARAHQGVELLPLRAAEEREPLLADALSGAAWPLGPARAPAPLAAQASRPLHALAAKQRVLGGGCGRWLRGGGVTVGAGPAQQGLAALAGVYTVLHTDGHLGLRDKDNLP